MSTASSAENLETYADLIESDEPVEQKSREQLEAERAEWKHLFNQVIENFPEPIMAVDDQGRLRYLNEREREIYGHSRADIGSKAYDVFGTEGESEILAETVARTGEAVREEEFRKVPTPDGHVWNRAMAIPVETRDGDIIGSIETTTLFTELVEERNTMASAQEKVSAEIDTAVTDLRERAEAVAESSAESSDIAAEQAEQMERINREIADLSASIEEVAATVDEVATKSEQASELAVEGQQEATDVIEVMDSVKASSDETATDVDTLRKRLDEIDEIVEVIDDIADQTNMLALNASIEAARADTSGEGFAVVADEIKSLANQSQEQATEIEQTVDSVKQTAIETVESIEATNEELTEGVTRTEAVMDNLSDISQMVTETAEGIEDVATASDDQATSTEAVAGLIDDAAEKADELSDEIETIAAANREQTEAVEDIEDVIDELDAMMARVGNG